jgi:hypothetical protein
MNPSFVVAGLVPASRVHPTCGSLFSAAIPIRDAQLCPPKRDGRVKPGHDGRKA